ncbi:RNA polymerase sigma factor [Engelhardtia mirabilis]|uniref:ECF RNA polymerase sigma-E factor n=1 Tax=Engelhardtia mirabilis TaxID=2528011 RepID=A0A518BG56_9BACT|nr:ECF RNA polymerase sigma-E factor [Planctomycetes bacterium Pla133]QDV00286.1 ECF RNA polymerase sigma-E factor [Planctomycetes bacterium Pla86]
MESLPTPTDEALAERAQDGDLDAFEALVVRHGGALIGALERMLGDHHHACDAAQDAWIKVHRALPSYRRGARFRPWLYAIALNQGRDALRARKRRPGGSDATLEVLTAHPGSDPDLGSPERAAIAAALGQVDTSYREAVILVDVLGLGYAEAAAALECAEGTVKSRVHRGRVAFRDAYERVTAPPPRPAALRTLRGGNA